MTDCIDEAVFFGKNKPSSWIDGIIPSAIQMGNAIENSSDIAEDVNQLMGLVEEDGFDVTGFAGDISNKSRLRGLRDQNGGLLFQPALTADTPSTLYAQPINYVKNGSWDKDETLMLAGDFTQAVYSVRQDMTYCTRNTPKQQRKECRLKKKYIQHNKTLPRSKNRLTATYITLSYKTLNT